MTSRKRRWRRWLLAGLGIWLMLWLLGISGNTVGRYFGWIVPPDEPQVLDHINETIGSRTADGRAIVTTRPVRPARDLVVILNWARLVTEGREP